MGKHERSHPKRLEPTGFGWCVLLGVLVAGYGLSSAWPDPLNSILSITLGGGLVAVGVRGQRMVQAVRIGNEASARLGHGELDATERLLNEASRQSTSAFVRRHVALNRSELALRRADLQATIRHAPP